MKKNQIIVLIVVYLVVTVLSTVSISYMMNHKTDKKKDDILEVGKYKLQYGKYIGYEDEYNPTTEKVEKKEVTLNLTKDTINGEKYEVKNTSLYVNNFELYKVTGNNKITILAGEGVEYEYEEK